MRRGRKGIARRIRRAFVRMIGLRDFLGLAVCGLGGPDPAQLRVSVRLRGPQDMDGGTLIALMRRLRHLLRLAPGARLPVLVIHRVQEDAGEAPAQTLSEAQAGGAGLPGSQRAEQGPAGPKAGAEDVGRVHPCGPAVPDVAVLPIRARDGCCDAPDMKRRRSRWQPSPWSAVLSACG